MEELITKKTSNPPFPKQVISELPLKLVPKVGNRRWTHRDTSASPSTALRQWTECTPGPRKTMAALFRVPPSEKQRSYRHEKVCGCTVVWISLEKRYCRAGEVTGVLLQYLWGGGDIINRPATQYTPCPAVSVNNGVMFVASGIQTNYTFPAERWLSNTNETTDNGHFFLSSFEWYFIFITARRKIKCNISIPLRAMIEQ